MKSFVFVVALLASSCGPTLRSVASVRTTTTPSLSEVEKVVQIQLEAYNRRDLDAFLATYSPDVRIYDHPNELRVAGMEQMRQRYQQRFSSSPDLHARISKRIVQGDYVIDHEHVTGLPAGAEIHTVAVYEVRNGRIQNVWFID